jgi:hypothetical protein
MKLKMRVADWIRRLGIAMTPLGGQKQPGLYYHCQPSQKRMRPPAVAVRDPLTAMRGTDRAVDLSSLDHCEYVNVLETGIFAV